ncbi:hypothetical protein MKX03_013691, partial [Papaver bracteatum]
EELCQFAEKAYWYIQSTRHGIYDESRRRALYNTPTTHHSSQTYDGLMYSKED